MTLFVAGCAVGHQASGRPDGGSRDLVVDGVVENLDYQALDEWGANGRMTARLRITRTVRGHAPAPVITIRYIGHSYLADDRELRLRLRRDPDGGYLLCRDKGPGYVCR